jgi:hypothetical protein
MISLLDVFILNRICSFISSSLLMDFNAVTQRYGIITVSLYRMISILALLHKFAQASVIYARE